MRRKRARRLLAMGVAAGVIGTCAIAAILFFTQRSSRQATNSATAELRTCVLRAPLDAREGPSLRFRRLQLVAMSRSDAERTAPGAHPWPLDCHAAAGRALDALKNAGTAEADLKPLADFAKLLDQPSSVSADLSKLVDAVFEGLDKLVPGPIALAGEALPAAPLNVDALAKVAGLSKEGTSLGHSFTEDNPGLSLPVLIDEKDLPEGPLLCSFRAADTEASCRTLSELRTAQQQGLRLLGTSDPAARPLIFAGQRGSEGVFVSGSGAYADRLYSYGGYSKEDGSLAVLGWDEKAKQLILSRKGPDGPTTRLTLKPSFRVGNFFYGSQILWDQILVRGVTADNERRLFVLPLAEADRRTFELADIGELPEPGWIGAGEEERPHLTGCRSDQMMVVRVRGEARDYLTFRIGSSFSRPVSAPANGLLGCYGTTATIVRVEPGRGSSPILYHDLCTSAGCTGSALKNEALDRGTTDLRVLDENRIAAVDLGGKLLVVWSAGERGGLRMRMASPETFDRTEDVLLLDDRVREGKVLSESTLLGFRLFSRERFAVLLLSTLAGLHALRIDPDGKVHPWPVTQPATP